MRAFTRQAGFRIVAAALAGAAALAVASGCGSTHSGGSSSSSRGTTSSHGVPVSAHPTCGSYCQQAGVPAGSSPPGYPCPGSGCLKCPLGGCISLVSTSATASGGVFSVRLTCELTAPCQGAFLLCVRNTLCTTGGVGGEDGRLAASDFNLPAGETAQVPVAATSFGEQVASLPGGFRGDVLIDLLGHGIVTVTPVPGYGNTFAPSGTTMSLLTADKGFTPPGGAVGSCVSGPVGGRAIFLGPNTSCQFGEAVVLAYERAPGNSANATITATSPVTKQTYTMHCAGQAPHVCTGANDASVIWY